MLKIFIFFSGLFLTGYYLLVGGDMVKPICLVLVVSLVGYAIVLGLILMFDMADMQTKLRMGRRHNRYNTHGVSYCKCFNSRLLFFLHTKKSSCKCGKKQRPLL